jgi:type VI secretion system secreted protein Hcp
MKFEGIDGQAKAEGHDKWFVCESMKWGVERNVALRGGGGGAREATQPSVSEVVVSKWLDISAPRLFSQACGKPLGKKVQFHVTRSDNQNVVEIVLENTVVAGYSYSHVDANLPMEEITLNFTSVEYKTIPYGPDNKAQTPVTATYDLAAGKPS